MGATPAAGSSTPSLHLAANEAFFSRPLLWKESTDSSLAAAAHRLAWENSGRPLTNFPGADVSGVTENDVIKRMYEKLENEDFKNQKMKTSKKRISCSTQMKQNGRVIFVP